MPPQTHGLAWLPFALLTVACWGIYGVLLHAGNVAMGPGGRYKAFLMVGVAYVLVAVLAPLVVMVANDSDWRFPGKGMFWSLVAGIAGALGAFFALVGLGKGPAAAVMSIIFAGAPIVNALVAIAWHPPAGGWGAVRWQFLVGIGLAALGGFLVAYYRPPPPKPAAAPAPSPATTADRHTPPTLSPVDGPGR